ncbi:MAG: hypothetical protein R2911_12640 [Caldilineaceae bacterium]
MRRYETYLQQHRERLLQMRPAAPATTASWRPFFHFSLYTWLFQFLADFDGRVTSRISHRQRQN